jgi:hypothetical protein
VLKSDLGYIHSCTPSERFYFNSPIHCRKRPLKIRSEFFQYPLPCTSPTPFALHVQLCTCPGCLTINAIYQIPRVTACSVSASTHTHTHIVHHMPSYVRKLSLSQHPSFSFFTCSYLSLPSLICIYTLQIVMFILFSYLFAMKYVDGP